MSDIVERLRAAGVSDALMIGDVWRLCTEAADEITSLRAQVAGLREAIAESLRLLGTEPQSARAVLLDAVRKVAA